MENSICLTQNASYGTTEIPFACFLFPCFETSQIKIINIDIDNPYNWREKEGVFTYNLMRKMAEETQDKLSQAELLKMSAEIVSAYVSNNAISADQVPGVINTVFGSLNSLNTTEIQTDAEPPKPAVSVRRSVTPDYIICLEDGKKLKMLKRHLRAAYDMTPEEYRTKWSLPADYPMVAPNYAEQRSNFAKKIGLGRKKGTRVARRK